MEKPIKMDDLGVPLLLETPKWTQSFKVTNRPNGKLRVVRTELLTAEEEDDISHPRRSNLFRWTQRKFHGLFFESVKIKIPNKSYSTPKK